MGFPAFLLGLRAAAGLRHYCLSPSARATVMSASNPIVVFILGGPGAGKGTQCAMLAEVRLIDFALLVGTLDPEGKK